MGALPVSKSEMPGVAQAPHQLATWVAPSGAKPESASTAARHWASILIHLLQLTADADPNPQPVATTAARTLSSFGAPAESSLFHMHLKAAGWNVEVDDVARRGGARA